MFVVKLPNFLNRHFNHAHTQQDSEIMSRRQMRNGLPSRSFGTSCRRLRACLLQAHPLAPSAFRFTTSETAGLAWTRVPPATLHTLLRRRLLFILPFGQGRSSPPSPGFGGQAPAVLSRAKAFHRAWLNLAFGRAFSLISFASAV
jgi:hypothetical protein